MARGDSAEKSSNGGESKKLGLEGSIGGLSAFFSWQAHMRLWLVALLGLIADQVSKVWAVGALNSGADGSANGSDAIVVINNYVVFRLVHNTGAVAGVASGKTGLLIAASLLAMGFLFWLFVSSKQQQWFGHIALGLLFGGALGNMWDRVFRGGKVVDFVEVDLHFWPCNPWPTFNVADVLLCVGVAALLLSMLRQRNNEKV
ncbi:MAG: signal peptidase II [Sedimentisphaerales bacterium]|nr:signal peptidase II [Sedimentisphaerales bacterium]